VQRLADPLAAILKRPVGLGQRAGIQPHFQLQRVVFIALLCFCDHSEVASAV